MNINELIKQATTVEEHGWGASYEHFDKEKFAKLVAAHEREECAKLCDDMDDDVVDGYAGWQYGEAIRARSKA